MLEYLIERADAEWFNFPLQRYAEVLRPIRLESRVLNGQGDHRIEVEGAEVSFSYEDPGFQVVFETGTISEGRADQIVAEVCENIETLTGQNTRVIKL